MKIEELDFTVRTYHALKRAGINTSEEVQRMTDDDLFRLRNIGKLSVAEIREKLPYIPPEKIQLPTMTNADKILAMSNGVLAQAIMTVSNGYAPWCTHQCEHSGEDECCDCVRNWLRQPAKEETP